MLFKKHSFCAQSFQNLNIHLFYAKKMYTVFENLKYTLICLREKFITKKVYTSGNIKKYSVFM